MVNRVWLPTACLIACFTLTPPAFAQGDSGLAAANGTLCIKTAGSLDAAAEAIAISARSSADDATTLMSCLFEVMPEKDFRQVAAGAAGKLDDAELSAYVLEVASALLLHPSRRRTVPEGLIVVPPRSS